MGSSVVSPGEILLGTRLLVCCYFSTLSSDSGAAPGRRGDREDLSRRFKRVLTRARSQSPDPLPTRVVEAVWTCRATRQHEIGIDLSLERLASRLADHRQSTLWIDIALKIESTRRRNSRTRRRSSGLEGGKTVANGQISTGDKIGAAGAHVSGDSITVISVIGGGRVRLRSGRQAGRGKWWRRWLRDLRDTSRNC